MTLSGCPAGPRCSCLHVSLCPDIVSWWSVGFHLKLHMPGTATRKKLWSESMGLCRLQEQELERNGVMQAALVDAIQAASYRPGLSSSRAPAGTAAELAAWEHVTWCHAVIGEQQQQMRALQTVRGLTGGMKRSLRVCAPAQVWQRLRRVVEAVGGLQQAGELALRAFAGTPSGI